MFVEPHLYECQRYQDVLPQIASGSVSAIITDPSYGVTAAKWDVGVDLIEFWDLTKRILSKGAPVVVFGVEPFSSKVRLSNEKWFKYDWVWQKTEPSGHLNAKKMPMRKHEMISVFCKGRCNYWPEMTDGHVRKTAKRVERSSKIYGDASKSTSYDSTQRYPTSVLTYSRKKQTAKLHPTQKPVELLRYLVRTYTKPGDLVCDPFMGSGSTGVACLLEGRRFVGAELHRPFFDAARDWIHRIETGDRRVA